jgi:[ribosomal protein S5]-alanine N-acetyltransferase
MRPTRLIGIDDAPAITQLLIENHEFLKPWEPVRGDEYFTLAGQRKSIEAALARYEQGVALPCVILAPGQDEIAGRVNLNTIVRGPFQSASVGYLVAEKYNGRGLATAAVADIKRRAFEDLGLHRLEASTLRHNFGSQKVLERNGFERFGLAPRYLNIGGEWQDHILFQVLNAEG